MKEGEEEGRKRGGRGEEEGRKRGEELCKMQIMDIEGGRGSDRT